LNECLLQTSKKENKAERISAPNSSVKYKDVQEIFQPLTENYVQKVKGIPAEDFELLRQFLDRTNVSIGEILTGKDAKRLHFICPILVIVCSLFNGDVKIKVEEDLKGNYVKANGHFEFMLERNDKRVCIVEAKKEDMEQGLAQSLIGCEVASDVDNLRTVYGIVTTFIQWTFLKSCDDIIERDDTSLLVEEGVVDSASLRKIAGKIYAMLSDET
jgi:hypothetical protein